MWSKALNQESTEPDGVHGRSSLLPAFPGALEAMRTDGDSSGVPEGTGSAFGGWKALEGASLAVRWLWFAEGRGNARGCMGPCGL